MNLRGTIPPMVTPVEGRTGGVDVPALRSYVGFLLEGGVHGLFACGSNGEFASLSREARRAAVETVAEVAGGEVPVLAGCGGTALNEVGALIEDADEAGADAAVVVTPYYYSTTESALREFYEAVADRSPLPIVLYNIPQLAGESIPVETAAALAEREGVVGIKDSSGDAAYHFRLCRETPDSFSVVQGSTPLAVAALDAGADGVVSGVANVFPGPFADLYDAHRAGDRERAVEILNRVVDPIAGEFHDVSATAAVKHLVSRAGHDVGPTLLPLPELDDEQRRRLDERYEAVAARVDAE